jgi:hypothetical protein
MKNRALNAASSVISFFTKLTGLLKAPAASEKADMQEVIVLRKAAEPPPLGSGLFMKWLSDEHPGLVRSTSPNVARVYNYADFHTGPPGLRLYAES